VNAPEGKAEEKVKKAWVRRSFADIFISNIAHWKKVKKKVPVTGGPKGIVCNQKCLSGFTELSIKRPLGPGKRGISRVHEGRGGSWNTSSSETNAREGGPTAPPEKPECT